MHEPQFVPARKMAPISATLVSRRLAIVLCKVFKPTPKQAQIVRPAAFAAAAPAGLPASRAVRISDSIRVPINELQIGQALRVKDLKLPEGVTTAVDPEAIVVQVAAPKVEEEAVVAPVAEQAEPEVIGRKEKPEEEAEE